MLKKILIGFGIFGFVYMIIIVTLMAMSVGTNFSRSVDENDILSDIEIDGYEKNGKVNLEISGDVEIDGIKGKMSKNFKTFTAKKNETSTNNSNSNSNNNIDKVIKNAESLIGNSYNKKVDGIKIDCGGLIQYAYKKAGDDPGKFKTNRLVNGECGETIKVAKSKKGPMFTYDDVKNKIKPGDVIVAGEGEVWRSSNHKYSHVRLYVGNGKVIEAIEGRKTAKNNIGNKKIYRIIRLIVNDNKGSLIQSVNAAETTNKTALKTWKALKSVGLTDEAAAGIMGNIEQECSFNAAYASREDYGLFNMNQDRAVRMKKYAAKRGKSWTDPQMQVEWMDKANGKGQFNAYTGKNPLCTYPNGTKTWWKKKITWKQFKKIDESNASEFKGNPDGQGKDKNAVELTAHIFCNVFERAGIPRMNNRRKYATKWYKKFVGKYPTGTEDDYNPIELKGTINGKKLKIEGFIGTHYVMTEGTFEKDEEEQKQEEKRTKKKFRTFHVIETCGGEEGAEGSALFSGEIEKLWFNQYVDPYKNAPYVNGFKIGTHGCGLCATTCAIIIQTGKKLTPIDVATKMRKKGGSFCCNDGTNHGVLGRVASWYGCKYKYNVKSTKRMRQLLKKGSSVVCAANGRVFVGQDGEMYSAGHYICFWKYSNKTYYAKDSTGRTNKGGPACKYTENQMKNFLNASGEQIVIYKKGGRNAVENTFSATQSSNSKDKCKQLIKFAKQYIGLKYVYRGTSLKTGVDCSGFTYCVYKKFGETLERSSSGQAHNGERVKKLKYAIPGDLIVYDGHVAIYLGNNKIIHASSTSGKVCIKNDAGYRKIVTIRRIFD